MATKIKGDQLDTGTNPDQIVQLDGSARLPAVDGSQLTGVSGGAVAGSPFVQNPMVENLDTAGFSIFTADSQSTVNDIAITAGNHLVGGGSGDGGSISLTAGDNQYTGGGYPGNINLTAGSNSTDYQGGAINITSGTGGTSYGPGEITISTPDTSSYIGTYVAGYGHIHLKGGDNSYGGAGYSSGILLTGGSSTTTGYGGYIVQQAGNSTNGTGGHSLIRAGNSVTANNYGAIISVYGGYTTNGGPVLIRAGSSSSGFAGRVDIEGGHATANNDTGGNIAIDAGNGFGSGVGGSFRAYAGDGGATGNGSDATLRGGGVSGGSPTVAGDAILRGGTATGSGHAGDVHLFGGTGNTVASRGGNIVLTPGNNLNSTNRGHIEIHSQVNLGGPGGIRIFRDIGSSHATGFYNEVKASSTLASNTNFTLPTDNGTYGFVLQTDGSGNTSWAAASGGAFTELSNGTIRGGQNAGSNITTGSPVVGGAHNFLTGTDSGTLLTTGDYNVSIGNAALAAATTQSNHIAIGSQALTELVNDAPGFVAIGHHAGRFMTFSGTPTDPCTLIGSYAGAGQSGLNILNMDGDVAVGANAMRNTFSSGERNTAVGTGAMQGLTNNGIQGAGNNVAVGFNVLANATAGDNNVAVGSSAGYDVTTGIRNTFVGDVAGTNVVIGTNNVCIGANSYPTTDVSNKLYIHSGTVPPTNDDPLIYGDFATNELTINGDLTVTGNGGSPAVVTSLTVTGDVEVTGNVISHIEINEQTGTTYTLILDDDGKLINMTNASANTVTVPSDASVNFPVGTQILISQEGDGTTSISNGGSPAQDPIIHSAGNAFDFSKQYTTVTLIKKAANVWLLVGDLV